MQHKKDKLLRDLQHEFKKTVPESSEFELGMIERAYDFAKTAHADQLRASGEPYFDAHCLPVARHVVELGMDANLVCAALLHDTIEDTDTTAEMLRAQFNDDIAGLVEGVSKLGKLKYHGNERHVESLRKFFVSVAADVRVVILKLADRWHNLETLQYLPAEKRHRIALESIMIHAPLASRLGMGKLVTTINDLAFPYAYPKDYAKTKRLMEAKLRKADGTITKMYRDLVTDLHHSLGYTPKIDRRIKSVYSLHKKLERKKWNVDEVYDLVALRAIVRSVPDCYQALGTIHNHWRPVPGRIKDYIAVPKPNGYQSLHTTVFSGDGPIVEIQVRTQDMHDFNEFGIASHHTYKTAQARGTAKESFAWIEQLREFQSAQVSPNSYLKRLRTDFFQDRIFVFTPKGDVIDLPLGATVLDFAYAVHTKIGETASGGTINGKYAALRTKLNSGDIVEIVTNSRAHPSDKWLEHATTSTALNRIRRYLRQHRPKFHNR